MGKHICENIAKLPEIVKALLPEIVQYKIICVSAPMSVGKTTLIRQICIALGVAEEEIHSPTYSIVNEYQAKEYTIFHFDFYRLKEIAEAYDLGLEEYFDKGALCLMEWAEIVTPLVPLPHLKITIELEKNHRIFSTEIINF